MIAGFLALAEAGVERTLDHKAKKSDKKHGRVRSKKEIAEHDAKKTAGIKNIFAQVTEVTMSAASFVTATKAMSEMTALRDAFKGIL